MMQDPYRRKVDDKKHMMPQQNPRDLVMVTEKCEHCVNTVLYESPRCRLEITQRGRQWVLYEEYPLKKAKEEYVTWLKKQEEEAGKKAPK